jgi:thioredoxin 1
MPKEINDATFEKEVLKSDLPVLVDFWAPWCGPCRMVAPIIEKLSGKYTGKLNVCKLNVDDSPRTASKYNVMSIPTMIFYKGGKPVDTVIGALPETVLQQKIDDLLARK